MSAGGLSYSGLKTQSKVTLPSVEMWGTNMNILQDPYRSVQTRRIDKVGDTQSILLAQDESGDRICEMINVYSRGVNPMVSVSYDNYSNNAGARGTRTAASLPYKVENVRPPVLRQEDLLPLSRLPRNWFYNYSNPSFPDLVQAEQCTETDKCVRSEILHPSAFANKSKIQTTDTTQIRDAASNSIGDAMNVSAHSKAAAPFHSSMRDEPDLNPEKKSILRDKRHVNAQTNLRLDDGGSQISDAMDGGRINNHIQHIDVRSNSSGFDQERPSSAMDGGRIGDKLKVPVATHKYNNQQLASIENNFTTKDKKQLNEHRRIYEAFSKKSMPVGGGNIQEKDTTKFINKNRYLCIAKTNKTVENFVHPHESSVSTIPTKPFLYKDIRTQPTSIFHVSIDEKTKDKKGIIDAPLRVDGKTVASRTALQKILPHDNLSRTYAAPASQAYNISSGKTAAVHVNHDIESLDKGSVHDSIMHISTESAKQLPAGKQPTDDSTMTFRLNPHIYTNIKTTATRIGQTIPHDIMEHEFKNKTSGGSAFTNKNMNSGKNIMDGAHVVIHNDKKTPIYSATTNANSPFSRDQSPEFIHEQRRRVLHTDYDVKFDEAQVHNVADVYQIQSRDGTKRTQPMLPVGGFEGQGSAVPVFDQYDNYAQNLSDPQRDRLRQRTQDMFHERFPANQS